MSDSARPVVWITGASGVGKTTLQMEIAAEALRRSVLQLPLDGDDVRALFADAVSDADYSADGRRLSATRMATLAKWAHSTGAFVTVSQVMFFTGILDDVREDCGLVHVHLTADMQQVAGRDPKGLYARAEEGHEPNVVGVDLPAQSPPSDAVHIDASGDEPDWSALARDIMNDAWPSA